MGNTSIFAGFKIKSLRLKNKLSLIDTAKELDITNCYLSSIENCKKKPSHKILKKASKFFNVDVEAFYETPQLINDINDVIADSNLLEVIDSLEMLLYEKKSILNK